MTLKTKSIRKTRPIFIKPLTINMVVAIKLIKMKI